MKKLTKPLFLVTYGLVLFFFLLRFETFTSFLSNLLSLMMPFIWGFALAYLLNIPYTYFLKKVFKGNPEKPYFAQKKSISLLLSYVLLFFIIFLVFALVIPQLLESTEGFITNLSSYYESFESLFTHVMQSLPLQDSLESELRQIISSLSNSIIGILQSLLPSLLEFATNTASGIFNLIFTLIVSVYFLVSKDVLLNLLKRSLDAFASLELGNKLRHIADISNETFRGFIIGQLTDALIVGFITFIGASLFKFPYPPLIGFIAGVTNIIPVLGPFIGAVPCVFIILMADPSKVIWYIIFVIVLQQIDGNIICPKIVGDSIGLDGIWVLFAVIVGGGLFGIVGSFLSVPVFAILFKLYNEIINNKLQSNS